MSGTAPRLVLLAGDVHEAVAGRTPARLEIDRGVIRRVGADGTTTTWDVSGCRMSPTLGDSLGATAAHAFVGDSGEVRCWVDLAEWMPGVLRSDPSVRADGLGPWLQRVTDAVADAAGTKLTKQGVATAGERIRAIERSTVSRGAYLQLAAAVGTAVGTVLGLRLSSDALVAVGGLFALALVVLAAVPRALWPARRARGDWRIPLHAPAGLRSGELVGAAGALAHSTADGVRRWIPLDGPTAPVGAAVSTDTGRAVLEFRGASLDLTPRDPGGLPELTERLTDAGVRVRRLPEVQVPPTAPLEPSGYPGDARPSAGIGIGLVLAPFLVIVLTSDRGVAAAVPLAAAVALSLALGLAALWTTRVWRRAPR